VLPLDEHYKFTSNVSQLLSSRYRFLHDRVQQAAYGLTSDHERPALQLRSGRLLLAASSEEDLQTRLFTILEQLNAAVDLIVDAAERARLLELNIRGGIQAKTASAYSVAVRLLRRAKQLLTVDAWRSQPEQTLLLYKELAEAEYLAGNFEQAESLYPEGIAASDDVIARVTLCLVQADQYCIQGRFDDSHQVLLRALELLGRDFPKTDEEAGALFPGEFESTERLLARYSHGQLLQAEEVTSPEVLLELRIYYALSHSTYQTGLFKAFVMVGCRMVQVTLTHGQSDLSCIGYVAYLTAMSAMRKPYPLCYRMGKLALNLAEQRDNKYFRLTVYQYFSGFYQHWMEPLADTFAYLEKGIELGHSGINPLSAGYATLICAVNKFAQGIALDELELECEGGLKFLSQSHQPSSETMLRFGALMPVQALRGKTLHRLSFDSAECSASEFFKGDFQTPSIPLAFYSSAMIRHAYLMDECALWRQFSSNLGMVGTCLPDSPCFVEACFYTALGLLRFESSDAVERADNAEAVSGHLAQFKDWATGCPENFHHKYLLIAAEQARVAGDDRNAMDLYAQAIDAAKAADFVACEALANELYARFWVAQNQRQLATNFVRDAYFHFQRWGAATKCAVLEEQWPQIAFRAAELRHSAVSRSTTHRNVSEKTGLLDLHSLLKANQVLAKEIQLDALLQKMIEVLLESAGAESAAIVLEEDDQLIIEAVGALQEGRRVACERIGRQLVDYHDEHGPLLPAAIIEQARLTRSTLVLNNPAADERFSNNHYLRRRQPKSVMCLPVVSQGRLVAVLYLENNQLEHAFTARHQVTLELLGAQAAISLVNARLYESMEEKIALRTEELRQMTLKDGLTGIANRRSLDERFGVEWRRALRSGQPLSLLLLDIDHFKQYNDHYGHLEGDQCIRAVAQMLQHVVGRPSDTVARYGGEEFAILLPETDAPAASRVAESCMRALAKMSIEHAHSLAGAHLSLSIGVCTLRVEAGMDPNILIAQADQALYQAKREGRARYCHFTPVADESLDR
jgi:diguanylate cyclase (GGDEF)-like protein